MMPIIDNELKVCAIGMGEAEGILAIYKECEDFLALGPQPRASMPMVLKDLDASREGNRVFCGIFLKGSMVGIVDFAAKGFEGDPNRAYLALLMISKQHRHQGIGTRVVKLIESEITADPEVSWIYSGVQVNNAPAIDFWLKMGYAIYAGPELMPDETTAYHLRKKVEKRKGSVDGSSQKK